MKKIQKILIILTLISVVFFAIWYFKWNEALTVENLSSLVNSHKILAPIIFVLSFSIAVVLFLPASILSILAGALFGSFVGFIYTILGVTIGATISFYIARRYGKRSVQKYIQEKFSTILEYDKKISKNGFVAVLIVRLTPLVPFKVPNYLFGLTNIKSYQYISGTFIGMIPESLILVYFGHTLLSFSFLQIAIGVLVVSMLFIFVWWYFKYLKRN